MHTVAVVLAGGTGERFGTGVPKQLLPFAGRPLIEHSVAAFDEAPAVDAVLVVMAASHVDQVRDALVAGGYRKLAGVIPGGPTRVESTRRAISELGSAECDVLFHDAARPLVITRSYHGVAGRDLRARPRAGRRSWLGWRSLEGACRC